MNNYRRKIDPSITFIDALYYESTFLPLHAEYLAVQQILEFAWLGLGMCGDKNQDGKLELHELAEYMKYLEDMFCSDPEIIAGLKSILKKFSSIAGAKRYLDEGDLFQYKDCLLKELCVQGLARTSLTKVVEANIALLLKIETTRNRSVQSLISEINNNLDQLQAVSRIDQAGSTLTCLAS